jgi:hypothetical protein
LDIKTELVVFLRNSDILSTTQRGVTTTSNTFTATAGQTVFTISNNVVRNIRSVAVEGTSKSAYKDYTPSYATTSSTVTLLTGASVGELVAVYFDYSSGTTEKVWADYPEIKYLVDDCPRIGFDIMGIRTKPIGIGEANWLSDAMITIKVYDKNTKTIDNFLSTIRTKLKAAQKSFYHFQFTYPTNIGPPLLHDIMDGTKLAGKVFEKAIDILFKYNYEE